MQKKDGKEQVRHLISLGKEKGFLTYAEVSDHLPPEIIASERLDEIVMLFGEEDIELIDPADEGRFRREKRQAGKSKDGKSSNNDGDIDLLPRKIE